MDRRRFVSLAGTTAFAGIAGCLGSTGSDSSSSNPTNGSSQTDSTGGDSASTPATESDSKQSTTQLATAQAGLPGYAPWVVEGGEFVLTDLTRVAETSGYESLLTELSKPRDSRRRREFFPFAVVDSYAEALPTAAALVPLLFYGVEDWGYQVLDHVDIPTGDGVENQVMTVEQYTTVLSNDMLVLRGQIDEAAMQSLESVEQLDTYAGYTLYDSGFPPEPSPFAVVADSLLIPAEGDTPDAKRALLESAIDIRDGGVGVGDDLSWLLERCGTGAFVVVFTEDDEDEDDSDSDTQTTLGVDQQTVENAEAYFDSNNATAGVMVADGYKDGRVTRSGFRFESADDVPPGEELIDVIAADARETNVVTDANRMVVEAFWDS